MQTIKRLPYYLSLFFLAYMPFHIFLVQSLSLLTGGLEVWKVAKDVLLAMATLFVICMVWARGLANRTFITLVGFGVGYALLHVVVWLAHPDIYRESALIGTVYNVRLVCFLIVGYGAVLSLGVAFGWRRVMYIAGGAALLVATLGVVQYFLPADILTHVGYGIERGARPNFMIDGASGFTRIMSTLRDPNSLGAFLLVPMTALGALVLAPQYVRYRRWGIVAFGVMGVALLLTFSRSAWMAACVSLGLYALWRFRSPVLLFVKRFGLLLTLLVLACGVLAYSQRHSAFVTSYITHSSQGSQDIDSNEYHWLFVKQGVEGIIERPFGHGPGTAGLASIQNPAGSFLTENYYVQIGYELGVIGLAAFVGLQAWVYYKLWRIRRQGLVPMVLLATFWGYVLMNMLLHTWANEAVACQWWILAGMALAAGSVRHDTLQKVTKRGQKL